MSGEDISRQSPSWLQIPLGRHAYLTGQLVHTNEVLVLLGCGLFAERTAAQARDIAARRLQGTMSACMPRGR